MTEYEKTVLTIFSKAVKAAMKERGIGINDLHQKADISKNSLYKVLRAESYNITTLIRIMRILKIHLEISLMDADNNVHTMLGKQQNLN